MWDYQIARHIARAFQLMLDPSSKKTPVDETQKPAGVIQYRLANGALVSHAEGGEGLKMTLSFPGGTVTVEVICERCRKCKEVLFPDKGSTVRTAARRRSAGSTRRWIGAPGGWRRDPALNWPSTRGPEVKR